MSMSSSGLAYGFTTRSETALGLTRMKLLEISDHASHEDLLAFLSAVQSCEVDILPLMWYPALNIGRGGSAVLNQLPVNEQLGFVFKRLASAEGWPGGHSPSLSSSMTELAILRHHNVRKHPNIIDLYGISWEVNPLGDRILPVLVLEKARYGDLFGFRNTHEGKNLSLEMKLSLCAQVAEGLTMLHASLIIHGDIKPQNILIFEDNEHRLIAKIADFGSSSTSESEEDMCQLPRSDPWNAPEYSHRKFSNAAAKKTDTYSFAMLCVWLLLDESHGVVDGESAVKLLRQMKETNNFKDKVCELIESLVPEGIVADKLVYLFRMTLVEDPFERTLSMQDLAELLNPDRNKPIKIYRGAPVFLDICHVEFSISHNLYPLTYANYLVRKLIFQCLEHKAKFSSCRRCKERAAFELAFCYYIGFGIGSDRQLAQHWAAESGNDLEDIEDEKDEVIDYLFQENPVVNALRARNFSMVMDHVNEYRKPDYDINMVQEILTREIRDLNQAFKGQFLLTATLQGILASIFLGLGRMEDAERLYRELVGFFERSPDHGSTHRDTLLSQRLLAETIRQQGRLETAEELIRRVLINSEEVNGGNDPHVLQCKATLGAVLFDAERLEEATALFLDVREKSTRFLGPEHEQTLIAMSNLACAYRERNMLHKAEDLDLEVLEAKKRTLDDEFNAHFSTVTSAANLALTYYRQQRWDEAEKLEIWVVQERTKSLGALHPATLLAKRQLAETYRQQGRVEDAGVL